MFKILHTDGNARRGEFHTVHGVVQTPVFQNVGTIAGNKRCGKYNGFKRDRLPG